MGFWSTLVIGNKPKGNRVLPRLRKLTHRDLIRMESKIGATVFGPIPAGHRREFFCLDHNTWVWFEEWTIDGKRHQLTTRYEMHPNGILKVQDGQPYQVVEGEELENLITAIRLYRQRVLPEIYHRDPNTGQPLRAA